MENYPTCAMCGNSHLRVHESHNEVTIDGTQVRVPLRSHVCETCGSIETLDEDLRTNARAVRGATKQHRGLLTGPQVRDLRKRLGISQDVASKVFGGGPVAFSKYENDEIVQSDAMDRLLWIVGECPSLLEMLAARANVSLELKTPPTIKIDVRRSAFSQEFFIASDAFSEFSIHVLGEFEDFTTASNDRIYISTADDRPAERTAA